jgi:hypothetical protein
MSAEPNKFYPVVTLIVGAVFGAVIATAVVPFRRAVDQKFAVDTRSPQKSLDIGTLTISLGEDADTVRRNATKADLLIEEIPRSSPRYPGEELDRWFINRRATDSDSELAGASAALRKRGVFLGSVSFLSGRVLDITRSLPLMRHEQFNEASTGPARGTDSAAVRYALAFYRALRNVKRLQPANMKIPFEVELSEGPSMPGDADLLIEFRSGNRFVITEISRYLIGSDAYQSSVRIDEALRDMPSWTNSRRMLEAQVRLQ